MKSPPPYCSDWSISGTQFHGYAFTARYASTVSPCASRGALAAGRRMTALSPSIRKPFCTTPGTILV